MTRRFGMRQRAERLSRGLSLREIERRTGIGSGYLSWIESGKRPSPPVPIAREIAAALGADRDVLASLAAADLVEATVLEVTRGLDLRGYVVALETAGGERVAQITIGGDSGWPTGGLADAGGDTA